MAHFSSRPTPHAGPGATSDCQPLERSVDNSSTHATEQPKATNDSTDLTKWMDQREVGAFVTGQIVTVAFPPLSEPCQTSLGTSISQ